ncbi:sodium/calcium exchanger protein [Domibacillus robiginosus]|uniref:sodium/calcium exchanger protein n=1 Tax=Domibacillus robiginosus TaxID=1071054 RepID=UPI00067D45E0|nr:sodium/calcium exchanger protein [Domibacillus robiginosus]
MTYWDILGIEPVDDLSALKKAYAKKLKVHHPEEDPEGYQRLREAYDTLTKELKRGTDPFTPKQESQAQTAVQEAPVNTYTYEEEEEPPFVYTSEQAAEENAVGALLQQAEQLYEDITQRIQPGNWISLLNDPALWDLTVKKEAALELFDFFKQHPFLPKEVWQLLEDSFHWRENYPEFLLEEEEDRAIFLSYYQKQLGFYPALSFKEIAHQGHIEADFFLQKRERALDAFLDSRLEEAKELAEEAEAIFAEDPDLLKLQGEIHLQLKEWEQAALFYDRYLALKPNNKEAMLAVAQLAYKQKDWKQALALCTEMADLFPRDADVLSLKAKCLIKEGETGEALLLFQEIESHYPHDAESMVYSAKIYAYAKDAGRKGNGKNGLPSRRESKQKLRRSTMRERIRTFGSGMFNISTIFWAVVFIISWNGVTDTVYENNPFVFMFLILGAFLFSEVSLDFIDGWAPFIWETVFVLALFFLIRSIFRALKAARY